MKIWLTADWHLGEDRMELMQRPFKDANEHLNAIIDNHNSLVGENDLVYVIGDAMYTKADPKWIKLIAELNGKKILLRGNHDRPFTDEQYAPYFEEIIPEGEGIELDLAGVPCYLNHYPSLGVPNRFNVVGHIHAAWKFQLNSLNVGVDANHFRPVAEDQIPFFLRAITEFYDNDVWTAYNPINADFVATRGKKSNYFVKA